ncbi:hypothetical protein BV899_11825 [Alcaligenes phenolicus]|nr:hypothetical protein BV899_11825 [Alcaligenes phenolicus]
MAIIKASRTGRRRGRKAVRFTVQIQGRGEQGDARIQKCSSNAMLRNAESKYESVLLNPSA